MWNPSNQILERCPADSAHSKFSLHAYLRPAKPAPWPDRQLKPSKAFRRLGKLGDETRQPRFPALPSTYKPLTKLHDFYKTKEGHAVLRAQLRPLMEAISCSDKKLAELIAVDQTDEERDRTRQQIRRWLGGQEEFWPLHPDKERLCLMKLEDQMMLVPTCRAALAATASSKRLDVAGAGLAVFMYGDREPLEISADQEKIEGLYKTMSIQEGDKDSTSGALSRYHQFTRTVGKTYMIAHEFTLRSVPSPRVPRQSEYYLAERRSGFAFPQPTGEIYRFLKNVEFPTEQVWDIIDRPLGQAELDAIIFNGGIAIRGMAKLSRTFASRLSEYSTDTMPYWNTQSNNSAETRYLFRATGAISGPLSELIKEIVNEVPI